MNGRYWIFLGAVSGLLAAIAGAIGAHVLNGATEPATPIRVFNTAHLYHAIHSLALIGVGLSLLFGGKGRTVFTEWALQLAGLAFTTGIVCFSGGIYLQIAKGFASSAGVVPAGGLSFMLGWAAFTIGALGLSPHE